MTFDEILSRAIEMLQRRGRLTYRMLRRQFDLDDAALADLKEEILYSQSQVVDDEERGLVWTGDPTSGTESRRDTEAEMRLHSLLPAVMALLQRDRRVTYRTLKYVFGVDAAFLEDMREELSFRRLAIDEDGKGLAWTGETSSAGLPGATPSRPSATPETVTVAAPAPLELAPSTAATDTPHDKPTVSPESMPTDAPQDEPAIITESVRIAPEAERRQLTVMFCDLAESTQLSQQLDPEDLREVIRAYQETAAEIVRQYEGYIAQYLGDGLLIYFGWPRAHEDGAQRALHTGLGIVEAITTTLNPHLEQDKGVELAVRIGIHTGPVVVGEMGGGGRHEHLALGETTNIAARLEGLAAPNTVVISPTTMRLVEGAFALENLGTHALKGVAEPMQVCHVLGPREVPEGETVTVDAPFLVGCDEEVGLLLRRWGQSKEGLGQVVLISGGAGIGKSSLVAMVRHHVVQAGYTRITFRCSPYHTNSSLYPVITHLEHVLRFDRDDTPDIKLDKLEQVLRTTSLPPEESVPLLATLLSVPIDDRYPAPTLSPQQQRQQTLDTLAGWLLEEARHQPVLAVWEDLHWADPSTLEMLGLVLEQAPTVPMLHMLTFRPEFEVPWPTRSHMTPITLNRLERPQVEALIFHLAGGKMLPDEVVQHIIAKTDGVPLYVEELTKMLLKSALLREEAEQYMLTGSLVTVAIPDTLQDSLMARLDQMHTAKEVAQLGAVLGREFSYDLIQAISPQDDETLQAGLAQLVQAELLYQRGRPPRATYRFKHALIQDAAYASLLKSTRQQVHQQIAQLFEARFPELVEMQPELLAHHCTEAGLHMQAVDYWQRAGQHAAQRSANLEAISHLSKGLELLATLPETREGRQQELTIQMALGLALAATRGITAPEVERAYARARELCQQVGETPQLFPVLQGLWQFYNSRTAYQTAREIGDQLFNLAQREHEPARLLAAHQALGTTLYFQGEFVPARTHLEEGIALAGPEHQRAQAVHYTFAPVVVCSMFDAQALWILGFPDRARRKRDEGYRLAQALAHPHSLVFALYHSVRLSLLGREVHAVREMTESFKTLATDKGMTLWIAVGTFMQGWVLAAQGQGEAGVAQMRQGMAETLATGAEVFRLIFLLLLAEAHEKAGQVDAGLHLLMEALAVTGQSAQRYYEAEMYRLRGALLLQQATPDASQAKTCFQQALAIARRQQAKSWELRAATSLARLWQRQDKRQDAYDLLFPVYEWFTEGFDTADLQEAKALLVELA